MLGRGEQHRLQSKRRESRERAEEACDQKQARDRWQTRSFNQRRQQTNEKAATDIHRQCAERSGVRVHAEGEQPDAIATECPHRTSGGDGNDADPRR